MHLPSRLALVVACSMVGSVAAAQDVLVVPAAEARAAVVKGNTTIVPQDSTLGYRVSTGLKTAPGGEIERHAGHSHIFFILEGGGTLVTGGTIVNPRELRPGELTGTDITGGTLHPLTAGDVITVPVGVPHWWKVVPKEVRYYAVHVYTKR